MDITHTHTPDRLVSLNQVPKALACVSAPVGHSARSPPPQSNATRAHLSPGPTICATHLQRCLHAPTLRRRPACAATNCMFLSFSRLRITPLQNGAEGAACLPKEHATRQCGSQCNQSIVAKSHSSCPILAVSCRPCRLCHRRASFKDHVLRHVLRPRAWSGFRLPPSDTPRLCAM